MIETYNIRSSYTYYRKELLKQRLIKLKTVIKDSLKDSYERLPIKLIERLEKENNIEPPLYPSMTMYTNIVHGYLKFLMKKVFEGNDVRIGARLGTISIRGKKIMPEIDWKGDIKGIAPNWSKTKEKWKEDAANLGMTFEEFIEKTPKKDRKLVYCFNEHTDYIRYRLIWYKKNVVVKNKIYYGLTFNRVNRRMVWKLVNEGKQYLITE